MADQAHRRAPTGQAQENPPGNNHAYEELRHLIIAPEQEELADIQERLDDRARRTQDVSSVVAEAIIMRRDQRGDPSRRSAVGKNSHRHACAGDSLADHQVGRM